MESRGRLMPVVYEDYSCNLGDNFSALSER